MSQLRDDVDYTSEWVREPQGRGTLSILYTCTITLVLCVYTAIHLNIPPAGEPRRWQFLRKVKWMFIAIFAPEAVLFTAISQFWAAWEFCRDMERLRADLGGGFTVRKKSWWKRRPGWFNSCHEEDGATFVNPETPRPPGPFSIMYGFYVVMGGLTFDVSDMHNDIKSLTLSPTCVLEMARSLKDWQRFAVSDTTIEDKSKADTLAKSLVVLQVSWLFLQCITRASQGRPLTILEVHTLVHAFCAMLMYGLWFNKPLDIRDATAVNLPEFKNIMASTLMDIPGSIAPTLGVNGLRITPSVTRRPINQIGDLLLHKFVSLLPRSPESKAVSFDTSLLRMIEAESGLNEQDYEVFTPAEPTAGGTEIPVSDTAPMKPAHQQGGDYVCTLRPGQFLRCGRGLEYSICWSHLNWDVVSYSLTAKDVLRWKRAANEHLEVDRSGSLARDLQDAQLRAVTGVSMRSKNVDWSWLDGAITYYHLAILGVVTSVYGAIHLALWDFAFPSRAEMLLWKVSGCTMAVPLVVGAGARAASYVPVEGIMLEKTRDRNMALTASCAALLALGAYVPLYLFARVFIVVESFLSLRMVPVGVYEGITWADYIPHL